MPGMAPDDVEDLKKRLRQHDQMYAAMQQQGKPFEALEHLEKGLFVRKELFGPDHPEVGRVCQVFTTSCNTLAMNSLQRDNHMLAYELLKKAEILTSPSGYITDNKMRMKLRAVTFNNFGCFYKRRGKLHAALQYLAKALKIELTSEEVDNPAGTHLNLCATLSQLGRHGPALEHAQCALELLEAMQDTREQGGGGDGDAGGSTNDDGSILAIAWHNIAVEQEHLGMLDSALHSYEQAVLVAEREWGAGHIKTLAIKHSLEEARGKAATRRSPVKAHAGHSAQGVTSKATSPLDAILNPASATPGLKGGGGFRQSNIASKKGPSPLARGNAKVGVGIKAYGTGGGRGAGGGGDNGGRKAVQEGWSEMMKETHEASQVMPGTTKAQAVAQAAPVEGGTSDGRRGPKTPPPPGETAPRPRR